MPILNYTLPMQIVKGVDTSNDTVTPESMLEGTIALDATGAQITGTITTYDGIVSGGISVVEEASMYSYNGTILPALPEWDKETYPYAQICEYRTYELHGYHLVVSTAPLYSTDTSLWQLSGDYGCLSMNSTCYTDNEKDNSHKWFYPMESTEVWTPPYDSTKKGATYYGKPIWSNYDIEACDGNLKPLGETALPATEPVPVYE